MKDKIFATTATGHDLNTSEWKVLTRRGFVMAALSLAGGSLLACSSASRFNPPRSTQSFASMAPIRLKVKTLDIRDEWKSPMKPGNVEHQLPLAPLDAVHKWVQERLKTTGDSRYIARFRVHDASVVQKPLETQKGLSGAFRNDQAARYDANLEAELEVVDTETGVTIAQASATASRYITMAEKVTADERDQQWISLVEGLMSDFNSRMEAAIRSYMGPYLS